MKCAAEARVGIMHANTTGIRAAMIYQRVSSGVFTAANANREIKYALM